MTVFKYLIFLLLGIFLFGCDSKPVPQKENDKKQFKTIIPAHMEAIEKAKSVEKLVRDKVNENDKMIEDSL